MPTLVPLSSQHIINVLTKLPQEVLEGGEAKPTQGPYGTVRPSLACRSFMGVVSQVVSQHLSPGTKATCAPAPSASSSRSSPLAFYSSSILLS